MSQFNQGDAVIATLPVDGFHPSATLYVVTQTDALVTCLYFDGNKPVSVVIPSDWLALQEPKDAQAETTFPHLTISHL